ncbi:hypothetical protein CHS0354_008022, partial [Potamilus streckersoni]
YNSGTRGILQYWTISPMDAITKLVTISMPDNKPYGRNYKTDDNFHAGQKAPWTQLQN